MKNLLLKSNLILLFFSFLFFQSQAQLLDVIHASDAKILGSFGYQVSVDNDYMIVSSREQLSDTTAVYIFHKINGKWTEEFKISAPQERIRFGEDVSISGNFAAISAPRLDSGYVFIYERSGTQWLLNATLKHPDPSKAFTAVFGESLELDGNKLLIGANQEKDSAFKAIGAAFFYEYNGTDWVFKQRLEPKALTGSSHHFSMGLSMSGKEMVILEINKLNIYEEIGGIWNLVDSFQLIINKDRTLPNLVSIDNGTISVASENILNPSNSFAYSLIYEKINNNWQFVDTLKQQVFQDECFATSTKVRGNRILLSFNHIPGFRPDGSAFPPLVGVSVFDKLNGTWQIVDTLLPPFPSTKQSNSFGWSADFDGNEVIISSALDDSLGISSGSVYVFETKPLASSVFDLNNQLDLVVFPNPVSDLIQIKSQENLGKNVLIKIYDLTGKTLFNAQEDWFSTQKQISVQNFAQGIYLLEITSEKGIYQGKFVKK